MADSIGTDIKDYLPHFSKKMSKEMENYIVNEVFLVSRYIFVYRDKKQQFGYCTHCNKEFKTDNLNHNEKAGCPECKSYCTIKHSGRGRKYMQDSAYFVYYEKSLIDENIIVARGIYAERDYSGDYKKIETKYRVKTLYIFDTKNNKGGIMFSEPNWWRFNKISEIENQSYEKHLRQKSVHSHITNYRSDSIIYTGVSIKSIAEAVKNTSFLWSGWEQYYTKDCEKNDMVKFFDLYSKYPCVEYLIKLGFTQLVKDKLKGYTTYRTINWRGKDLFSVLKINKQQLQEIKSNKIKVDYMFLNLIQKSNRLKWGFSIKEINKINRLSGYRIDDLLKKIFPITPPKRTYSYLSKQVGMKINEKVYFKTLTMVISTYGDYINDCKKLEMDFTKDTVLFPRDLYTAHQNTIKQVKYKEDEELNKKIEKRLKELTKKYYFTSQNLVIRPAENTKELIEEGKALNHCVGGYAERYANKQNDILFIRKSAEMDKSYYTVEIINNKITQVRGKNNCESTDDVKKFIEEFTKAKLTKKTEKNKEKRLSKSA